MPNIIAYIRVSTEKQAAYGISLNGQKKQIKEWAKANTLRIREWFKDESSARGEENLCERDGFKKATELAIARKWPIVAATADRFSRSLGSYDRFIAGGGKAYSTDVGFGEDEAQMRARIARAQHDGNEISRRTREGQERARAKDKVFGNPRIAEAQKKARLVLRENKRLNYDEYREMLKRARDAGAKTDSDIALAFNKSGYVTTRGKPWTSGNVSRMRRESILDAGPSRVPAAGPQSDADPLLTVDKRLTDGSLHQLLDALAVLGMSKEGIDRQRSVLKGRALSDVHITKIKEKIEKANRKTLEDERAEKRELEEIARSDEIESLWGSF